MAIRGSFDKLYLSIVNKTVTLVDLSVKKVCSFALLYKSTTIFVVIFQI